MEPRVFGKPIASCDLAKASVSSGSGHVIRLAFRRVRSWIRKAAIRSRRPSLRQVFSATPDLPEEKQHAKRVPRAACARRLARSKW